ncbi:hypothetical protein AVEN_139205-1 [Araneus ventricosus]|uniref:Uncharacterized protein n=1 Tax=Araneus ventricosus TaxID=182803 RepID=A0A4Y2URS5_ARAVE|nr:hypothetical protein AVEN_139205-1 [Araneus ventricosus]
MRLSIAFHRHITYRRTDTVVSPHMPSTTPSLLAVTPLPSTSRFTTICCLPLYLVAYHRQHPNACLPRHRRHRMPTYRYVASPNITVTRLRRELRELTSPHRQYHEHIPEYYHIMTSRHTPPKNNTTDSG